MMRTLDSVLERHGRIAIAVSGGVDSMTLAHAAVQRIGRECVQMFHAISPAVPRRASERVRLHARRHGWDLIVIDAGEFADVSYLANPVNRCLFCKRNLYATIRAQTDRIIAAGTNLDDLGDYRPGLQAAAERAVVHPFVEARMAKADVRALARQLGLDDLAELPASPCLSSRIETGIRVTAPALALIEQIEEIVEGELHPQAVRCRIFKDGVVVQLDDSTLAALSEKTGNRLRSKLEGVIATHGDFGRVRFAPYIRGSAFRHEMCDV